ncbi:MAG: hypothetical protein OHK0023_16870 [Anaerolineae bacterium]
MSARATKRKPKAPQGDLFAPLSAQQTAANAPLAERMRPRRFSEYVGQEHIVGEGKLLRRAIEADQLMSIILHGAPGTGKTALANIIAHETSSEFLTLNAVLDGVQQLREVVEHAENRLDGRRTVVFVDEIHRWNKSQQDGLLPHIESGTIVLIGATTENPFYSLVAPLVSRSRLFKLEALTDTHIRAILEFALRDAERGYGAGYNGASVQVSEDALAHWVNVAAGDARSALNALELAVITTPPQNNTIAIDLPIAAESIQRRAVRYDRAEDQHYDTISAFIKSLRGSDPDAALYWMAKMLSAGEDPHFLFRRMIILSCEDVGLADPQALIYVTAAAEAFDRVGMPEGNYLLSAACLYLANAPKSNTTSAIFSAIAHIEEHGAGPVPPYLRDSTANTAQARYDTQQYGEGENPSHAYQYPHNYPEAWVAQQYLPEGMSPPEWYVPKQEGYEREIYARWLKRRRADE